MFRWSGETARRCKSAGCQRRLEVQKSRSSRHRYWRHRRCNQVRMLVQYRDISQQLPFVRLAVKAELTETFPLTAQVKALCAYRTCFSTPTRIHPPRLASAVPRSIAHSILAVTRVRCWLDFVRYAAASASDAFVAFTGTVGTAG